MRRTLRRRLSERRGRDVVIRAHLVTHGAHPTPMVLNAENVAGLSAAPGATDGLLVLEDGTELPIDDADLVLEQMLLGLDIGSES